jgi:hypothetical protein
MSAEPAITLNTFVFLPGSAGPRWPVIMHRILQRRTPIEQRVDDSHRRQARTTAAVEQ